MNTDLALGGFSYSPDNTIVPVEQSFETALKEYREKNEKSNVLLIYPFLSKRVIRDFTGADPLQHHLLDFNSDQNFRKTHLVIETKVGVKQHSSYGIAIKLSYHIEANLSRELSLNSATNFTERTQKEIADAIREVESQLLQQQKISSSLFVRNPDGLYQYHSLVYIMGRLLGN